MTSEAVIDVSGGGGVLLLSSSIDATCDLDRYEVSSGQRRSVVVDGSGAELPVPDGGDPGAVIDNLAHLSPDGRYVAFRWDYTDCDGPPESAAVEVRVFDAASGTTAAIAGLFPGMGSAAQAHVT